MRGLTMNKKVALLLFIVVCLLVLPDALLASDKATYNYKITTLTPSNLYRIDITDSDGAVCLSQTFKSTVSPAVNLFDNGLVLIATSNNIILYSVKDLELVSMCNVGDDLRYIDSVCITGVEQNTVSVVYSATDSDPSYSTMYSVDKSSGKIIKEQSDSSDEGGLDAGFVFSMFICGLLLLAMIEDIVRDAIDKKMWVHHHTSYE